MKLKHALDTAGSSGITSPDKKEQDRIAEDWANEVLTLLAMNCDVESPKLLDEPFFGPVIARHIDQAIAAGNWSWAKRQKKMLAEGILFQASSFTICSEKEYFTLSRAGLDNDPREKKLNALVTISMNLLDNEWDRVEVNERLLREAVARRARLRIEYLAAEGVRETHVVLGIGDITIHCRIPDQRVPMFSA